MSSILLMKELISAIVTSLGMSAFGLCRCSFDTSLRLRDSNMTHVRSLIMLGSIPMRLNRSVFCHLPVPPGPFQPTILNILRRKCRIGVARRVRT
ncbi:hypothetical protein T440DRAFT_45648 [Plenodomus tracheiphilus IPT5]|uniref:Uncharacterized protein n=1 Tax=Plenodomus tracheiphilus IPT5 TaxID=1408161 RepID=A0A6A7APC2_9PLEO|nr:hypothetical protein T440DRAFT_45648 [Plenodomus tracheiphilus IPT5]